MLSIFNVLILFFGLFWFLSLTYRQRSNKYFLITPFIIFGIQEIMSVWGIPLSYAFQGKPMDAWEILVIGSAFLSFVVGFHLSGGNNLTLKSYLAQPITAKHPTQYYFMAVSLSIIFMTALGLYFYKGAPAMGVMSLKLLLGKIDINELGVLMAEQRFQLTKSHWFGGEYRGQGMIKVMQKIGWRFLLAVCLIMYIKLRSKKWLFLCILTSLLLVAFQAGTGERSPLAFSFLFILIVLSLMQKINPKQVIVLATLGFAFLMVTTYFSGKGTLLKDGPDFASNLASQLVERIFMGNAIHDLEVMEYVETGRMEKRLGMWHLEKFINSFPGIRISEPLGYRISYLRGASDSVFSSGTYLGLLYADFGYAGIVFGFFSLGIVLSYAQKIIFRQKRDIIIIVLSSMITFYLSFMTVYGVIGFASDIFMVVLFWGIFHFLGSFFIQTKPLKQPNENIKIRNKFSLP